MKKVLLLLAEGFEVFEASVFIDVIGWNLITSRNPSTAVNVALLLLEHLTTQVNAGKMRKLMGF